MNQKLLLYFFFCLFSSFNTIKINDNDFFTQQIRNLVRKIDRISKNSQDEKVMNILIEKLREYIFTHDIERKGAERSKYDNIRNISQNVSDITEDGTYDIYTKEAVNFDRGYQVSFETLYDTYTDEEFEDIAYKMSLLSDNSAYQGVYSSNPELSFHFDDLELATVLGIVFNQISIWDWSILDERFNEYFVNKTSDIF